MLSELVLSVILLWAMSSPENFWLMPDKFFYDKDEDVRITIQEGENFTGQYLNINKQIVVKADLYGRGKSQSLLDQFKDTGKEHYQLSTLQPGTYEFHLQTEQTLTQPAERFNQYLKDYDLDEIIFLRASKNLTNTDAQIHQTINNVLLFQKGIEVSKAIEPKHYPIEIIPHKNPYTLKKGDPIEFTILSEGKPVFGVRVKIWNRFNNRTTIQNIYTEQNGSFRTHISSPGPWMISVVKMSASKEQDNLWRSFQTNLVFGVK